MTRHRTLRLAPAAATLLSLAAAPALAQAPTINTLPTPSTGATACAGSTNGGGLGNPAGWDNAAYFNPIFGPSQCVADVGNRPTSASVVLPGVAPQELDAQGAADYGLLKMRAHIRVQNWQNEDLYFPRALAQVGWEDGITIDAPGMTGQQGTLTGLLHLTGTLSATGYQGGAAVYVGSAKQDFSPAVDLFVRQHGDDPFDPTDGGTITIDELLFPSFNFIFGQQFTAGVFALALASNRSEGGLNHLLGDATADFYNTLVWQGIQAVTSGGLAVSGYTVATASGNNWLLGPTATVPEPATLALTAGGLLALGGLAARRRRA